MNHSGGELALQVTYERWNSLLLSMPVKDFSQQSCFCVYLLQRETSKGAVTELPICPKTSIAIPGTAI